MAEEKKDLTGLLQYSKEFQESDLAKSLSQSPAMEEAPIEKIDNFESLEEYAVSNSPSESQPAGNPEETSANSSLGENLDFPITPPSETPEENPIITPTSEPPPGDSSPFFDSMQETPSIPPPPPQLSLTEDSVPMNPIEKVRQFSENLSPSQTFVPAAFPFSILIRGPLLPNEKEKLIEILSQENIGIREIDLEPQFESEQILIPRISEYAGVLLVQALRGAAAEIQLGPSDSIFATPDTQTSSQESLPSDSKQSRIYTSDMGHPAEQLPITSDHQFAEIPQFTHLDTLTASATLKSTVVEAESSSEYLEIIDALQREIKYKAYRKGASGIINLKIQLNQLSSPSHYRVLVLGTAIQSKSSKKE